EQLLDGHWTGTWAAPAMRRGEGLVQVQVHEVYTEVAGTNLADVRVHVGAVHVEQAALGMHKVGDLVNLVLKHTQRIGIGQHERGDVFIHLRGERRDVDHAFRV